jgi:hypothetical protein
MFGKTIYGLGTKVGKLFPTITATIRRMKREDGYSRPSNLLQEIEADLVVGKVCSRLMNEVPGCWAVSLHDAVYTVERWAETARAIMLDEYAKGGYKPTIRLERYGEALLRPLGGPEGDDPAAGSETLAPCPETILGPAQGQEWACEELCDEFDLV